MGWTLSLDNQGGSLEPGLEVSPELSRGLCCESRKKQKQAIDKGDVEAILNGLN